MLFDQLQDIKHGHYNHGGIDRQFARLLCKILKIHSRIGRVPLGIESSIEDNFVLGEPMNVNLHQNA